MESQLTDTMKRLFFFGSGVVLGVCAYATYKSWKKRQWKNIDEGFEDVSKIDDLRETRILVLGMEGSGKTTLISQLEYDSTVGLLNLTPTKGCKVSTREIDGVCWKFWELSGAPKFIQYWPNFLQDTDVLMFVVDASDLAKLSIAVEEVKWLLADKRLAGVPLVLVANKQDKRNALAPEEVADALNINDECGSRRKVLIIGTQSPPGANAMHASVILLEKKLHKLIGD